jgi:hypothetical protein
MSRPRLISRFCLPALSAGLVVALLGILTMLAMPARAEQTASAPAQAPAASQTLALTDTKGLVPQRAQVDAVTYKGRKAVRLTVPGKSTASQPWRAPIFGMAPSKRT